MIPYIDLHCDTLTKAFYQNISMLNAPQLQANVEKLLASGAKGQVFAIYFEELPETLACDEEAAKQQDELFYRQVTAYFRKGLTAEEIRTEGQKKSRKGLTAFLSIEDARFLYGDLKKIDWLVEDHIKIVTLTWNKENCLGYPNSQDADVMKKGLKPFGKEAVACLQEKGILVDVSHLSDGGFWDVAACGQPFLASHSNCRSLTPHPRNLTDDMIRTLAECGGVMGICYCPRFLNREVGKNMPETATPVVPKVPMTPIVSANMEDICAHIWHAYQIGGEDVLALGSDFDGFLYEGKGGLEEPAQVPVMAERLMQQGMPKRVIGKLMWKNAERILFRS